MLLILIVIDDIEDQLFVLLVKMSVGLVTGIAMYSTCVVIFLFNT